LLRCQQSNTCSHYLHEDGGTVRTAAHHALSTLHNAHTHNAHLGSQTRKRHTQTNGANHRRCFCFERALRDAATPFGGRNTTLTEANRLKQSGSSAIGRRRLLSRSDGGGNRRALPKKGMAGYSALLHSRMCSIGGATSTI